MEKDKKGKVTATYKLNGVQMWKINKVIGIGEKEHYWDHSGPQTGVQTFLVDESKEGHMITTISENIVFSKQSQSA